MKDWWNIDIAVEISKLAGRLMEAKDIVPAIQPVKFDT
jgi:hypothetical protein